jgi:hypothetical protein
MALPAPTLAPIVYGEILQGKISAIWVPTVASITAPTVSELSAGTDYKNQISGWTGSRPRVRPSTSRTPVRGPSRTSRAPSRSAPAR